MPLHRPFPPVYPNKDHTQSALWRKAGSYVSVADWGLINSLAGQSGIVSHLIDDAIHSAAQYIRDNNLRYPDDTPRFIEWLRQRSSVQSLASTQGEARDDGRGTPPSGDASPGVAHVPASPGSSDAAVGGAESTGNRGGGRGGNRARLQRIRAAKAKADSVKDGEHDGAV